MPTSRSITALVVILGVGLTVPAGCGRPAEEPGRTSASPSPVEARATPAASPTGVSGEGLPEPPPPAAKLESTLPKAAAPKVARTQVAAQREEAAGPTDPVGETPWEPLVSTGAQDYSVVTVFYGTDRKALDSADAVHSKRGWFHLTAVCTVLTIALAAIALWRRGSRGLRIALTAGTILTVVLGGVTSVGRLETMARVAGDRVSYGNGRGEFELGTCQVSVPRYHEVGRLERPSILRFEFREDPRRHVVLLDVNPEPPDAFYATLKDRVQQTSEKEVLVFVHGYNVTFEAAAQRTAQLAYDLKFEGAPIFFSWPSQGGLFQYVVDETNVTWAAPHLKQLLLDVAANSGAKSIHLIAHSMGNRALTAALAGLVREVRRRGPLFSEVILTAPDIDADTFKRDVAPAIVKTAGRITLYASSNDEALMFSRKIHGYSRAGDSGRQLVVVPGIDTIDVSEVDTSLIGHSYYGNNDSVLADMFYLVHQSRPPDQRTWLRPVQRDRLTYWVFSRAAVREAFSSQTSPRR